MSIHDGTNHLVLLVVLYGLMYHFRAYVADENTVKVVNYTNWETRNGAINKTVSLIVTPNVVVRL